MPRTASLALTLTALAVLTQLATTPSGWTTTTGTSTPAIAGPAHMPGITAPCPKSNGKPNFYAPGKGKTVALTFDDGPGTSTAQILAILMREGVRATFFNIGEQLPEHPDLLRQEIDEGQTVGDHTWDHMDLKEMTPAEQKAEITKVTNAQEQLTGSRPCLLRPPGGNYDSTTQQLAASAHQAVWLWSVDTEDWKADGSSDAYWVNRVRSRAEAGTSQPHPVVLMHNEDGPPDAATVAALPSIIDYYRSHGFSFVDLLGNHGFAPYAPTGAPVPALTTTKAGTQLFGLGPSHHVVETEKTGSSWVARGSLGGDAIAGPAAVAVSPTHLSLAITDAAHHVEVRNVIGGKAQGQWRAIGGRVVGRPALTYDATTKTLTLAARTTAGSIEIRQFRHGRWKPWVDLDGRAVTAPAVAVTASGVVVATVGAGGKISVRRQDATGWSAWQRLSGEVTSDPTLVTSSRGELLLLARSATGVIRARTAGTAGRWHSWRSLDGREMASGASALTIAHRALIVARGTDGRQFLATVRAKGGHVTATPWRPVS